MPEGPEVSIVVQGLQPLIGHRIYSISQSPNGRVSLFKDKPKYHTVDYSNILGVEVDNIYRRAKFICFHFANNYNWIIHLSYTGCFILYKDAMRKERFAPNNIYYTFNSSFGEFYYYDPRGLSHWMVIHDDDLVSYKSFSSTGTDVIDSSLSEVETTLRKYHEESRIKISIKEFLLKQNYLAGIGNIYASEILFDAKISPQRKLCDLNEVEIIRLANSIKRVINQAVLAGGSSTNDYFHVDGSKGHAQDHHLVYNKSLCSKCGTTISRIQQGARSTYFCERCQK